MFLKCTEKDNDDVDIPTRGFHITIKVVYFQAAIVLRKVEKLPLMYAIS